MNSNGTLVGDVQTAANVSDVYSARSVAEIRAALAELHRKDARVTAQLDTLVNGQKDLQRELGRLDLFRANLSTQASKTRSISNGMLSDAASTANRISSSVKRLDLEQDRIKSTLTVVEQVAELKACVLGVAGSMGAAQDWETAAGYLDRASKIPKEVVDGDFAARAVPTAEVPDSPAVTLENASESLCTLFVKEFEKSVKDNDGGRITRFFKLFPLINRSDVGLDVYGRYVCQGVAARARANLHAGTGGNQAKDGFFYANALTRLFEHIAQIIDGHGGLVERHYGPGKMIRVMERLQVEADLQGGIILDSWADERRVDRQLTDIKSYPYTFLVQSFSAPARGSAGTPRANSPAPPRLSEDEGVDMKAVDALLNEMTTMLSKYTLYTRFIADKCRLPNTTDTSETEPVVPTFLATSNLSLKISARLLTPFTTLTTFFFRRSLEKAFQLDEPPPSLTLNPHKPLSSQPPHITTAVEDIMFVTDKVLRRLLSTSSLPIVNNVLPSLARILSGDFIGMQQRKMRDESYPKAAIPGQLPPEATIISFLVLLNNLDVADGYISQITKTLLSPAASPTSHHAPLSALFPLENEAMTVNTTLTSLAATFHEKASELLSDGINVIFNNVMKPRLRPVLMDAWRDAEYQMTIEQNKEYLALLADELGDDDGSAAAASFTGTGVAGEGGGAGAQGFSPEVRMRFQHGWDALTKPIARIMTASTWDQLLSVVVAYLSKLLEKRIWTYAGRMNAIGASRLEHDVLGVVGVVVRGQKYAFRAEFERVRQICTVMNMDEEEWEEVVGQGAGGGGGEGFGFGFEKLKGEERERARGMVREVD